MEAGSLGERRNLVKTAKDLGLSNIALEDFRHVVSRGRMSTQGASIPAPEAFIPLSVTPSNKCLLITNLDVVLRNIHFDATGFSTREIDNPFLGRWLDNLNTNILAPTNSVFFAYNTQMSLNLMINRPILHVGLSNRMVGIGIAMPDLTDEYLEIATCGYLVDEVVGGAFASLETNFEDLDSAGDFAPGDFQSAAGVDTGTGQLKTAPGL